MAFTRRDFLKITAGTSAALALGCEKSPAAKPPAVPPRPPDRSRVVLVRDEKVLDAEGNVSAPVIAKMLDDGVCALLGETDPARAWQRLFRPGDVLGIKTNVWKFIRTPLELEEAVRQRALGAGVKAEDIAVDDRGVLDNPVFQRATALVNARPARTHDWAGVGTCLKNYIMFHPHPSTWHDDSCANLAGLWDLPAVKGKTRLNIQVVLTPLFHGKGPHHYQAEYVWPYKGLILGQDPVAVDATAVRLLEAKRRAYFGKDLPFSVPPKHVQLAETRWGLGVADPVRIDLVKVGWAEGLLI